MPCKLDARIAILDSVFTEFVDGRYSYTRVGDNKIRINNQSNNSKTRIKSKDYITEQANHMAKNLADRIWEKYNHHVIPKINNLDPYSPVTISLSVTDEYIEDAFIKLFPQTQIEFEPVIEEVYHPTNQQLENMFEEWYKENSNVPEDEAREYFFSCKI